MRGQTPFVAVPHWVIDQITPTEMQVYLALGRELWKRPTLTRKGLVTKAMELSGLSRAAVYSATGRLEELGALGKNGLLWWLPIDDPESTAVDESAPESTPVDGKSTAPDGESTAVDQHLSSQEPVDESKTNPSAAGAAAAEVTPKQARQARARELTDAWWEERRGAGNPVAQPYIACAKVVEGLLANGVPENRIEYGLRHAPVCSSGAIEMAIQQELERRGERETAPKLSAREARLQRTGGAARFAEAAGFAGGTPPEPAQRSLPLPESESP